MKETISANTLFHFTRNKNFLTSILKNGIYIRYSLESYGNIINGKKELVLPMTCFCDIPLSKIKNHTSKYGSYSIGLSKEWGIKNGLSPVIYTTEKSETANILNRLTSDLDKFFNIDDNEENKEFISLNKTLTEDQKNTLESDKFDFLASQNEKIFELSIQLGHFLKYIKPYQGKGYSNGKEFGNVKFYDEREWRYVPPKNLLNKIGVKDSYKREFYESPSKRRLINIKLASHKKLNFKPKDIKFIIVEKDAEIPHLIYEIREIFRKSATYDEIMLLTSRLISLEQIVEDL
ncbi:abortive infection system antitoxin AbiGi family protein [Ascidiimonas aurantiaca]|uniref:abortive infection system antitoxin AbiGi family protein n=1 Tax=Ascidiimonas aurantiaca TaxID=1685432 RepID=UPI0030EB292C